MEAEGIHKLVDTTINKCDVDIRSDLFDNVILSGGSTMFPGLQERMDKELTALRAGGQSVKVVAPDDRKYSVWIGGSILASLNTFESWVTKDQYEDPISGGP